MSDDHYQRQAETVIAGYGRQEAIADGILVDVSSMARERGFTAPVALTRAVHAQYVVVPPGVVAQDEKGRLWDILHMLGCAIHTAPAGTRVLEFQLYVRNDNRRPRPIKLKAVSGPGDDGQQVITVMLPTED